MIRNCRQEDMDCVGMLANAAWLGIYAMFRERYGEELFNLVTPNSHTSKSEQVLNHFRLHPDWMFICEREGRVVGFITFFMHKEKKLGEIYNNAVDPACGQKGVGQEMYAAVLDYFKAQGMLYATVHTGLDPAHERARRAYERAGFNISHEEVRYYKRL